MPKTMLVNNKADTQIHTVDILGWQQVAGGGGLKMAALSAMVNSLFFILETVPQL